MISFVEETIPPGVSIVITRSAAPSSSACATARATYSEVIPWIGPRISPITTLPVAARSAEGCAASAARAAQRSPALPSPRRPDRITTSTLAFSRSPSTDAAADPVHPLADPIEGEGVGEPEIPRRTERFPGNGRHLRLAEQKPRHRGVVVDAEPAVETRDAGEGIEGAPRHPAGDSLHRREPLHGDG